jgi:hypothetical protein
MGGIHRFGAHSPEAFSITGSSRTSKDPLNRLSTPRTGASGCRPSRRAARRSPPLRTRCPQACARGSRAPDDVPGSVDDWPTPGLAAMRDTSPLLRTERGPSATRAPGTDRGRNLGCGSRESPGASGKRTRAASSGAVTMGRTSSRDPARVRRRPHGPAARRPPGALARPESRGCDPHLVPRHEEEAEEPDAQQRPACRGRRCRRSPSPGSGCSGTARVAAPPGRDGPGRRIGNRGTRSSESWKQKANKRTVVGAIGPPRQGPPGSGVRAGSVPSTVAPPGPSRHERGMGSGGRRRAAPRTSDRRSTAPARDTPRRCWRGRHGPTLSRRLRGRSP